MYICIYGYTPFKSSRDNVLERTDEAVGKHKSSLQFFVEVCVSYNLCTFHRRYARFIEVMHVP